MTIEAGRTLQHYRLVEKIGEGGRQRAVLRLHRRQRDGESRTSVNFHAIFNWTVLLEE
jgi:hypothetical protein